MCNKSERGLTLIELLVFIVIVGIAASAMLAVFGSLTRNSASLLPDKQAQAIAASMMSEILAQPYTFCDPNDANAVTATSAAGCASLPEALGPEPGETRTTFDNVNDYNGLVLNPVSNPGGVAAPGLPGYALQVAVASAGAIAGAPAAETLRVTVTVTAPNGAAARLDGVRFRYAPTT
jgi:MSHA pilin protein MshD